MNAAEPYEHTGPFDAGLWANGARVRFADNGNATLDIVKAPHRAVIMRGGFHTREEVVGRVEVGQFFLTIHRPHWAEDPTRLSVPLADIVEHDPREPVVAIGVVNGPAIACYEDGSPVPDDGGDDVALARPDHWLVPCWCAREGREATTIYVDSRNVLGVVLPEPYSPASRAGKRGPR